MLLKCEYTAGVKIDVPYKLDNAANTDISTAESTVDTDNALIDISTNSKTANTPKPTEATETAVKLSFAHKSANSQDESAEACASFLFLRTLSNRKQQPIIVIITVSAPKAATDEDRGALVIESNDTNIAKL